MTLAIVSALLSAAFWAVASVAIGRFLASGIVSPAAANLFKNTTAAFMFLLGALIFGGHWPVGTAWAWLFLSGFLGFAVADTLYFAAFQRCGVQTAATVMLLNVPIATVLALPLAGDEIKTQVIPFAAVVLVGVLLVIVDSRVPKGARVIKGQSAGAGAPAGNPASDRGYGLGVLLAVVAAFAIGTSVPLGRGSFGDVSVFPGGFIRLVGGAVGAVPMAVLSGLRRNSSPSREVSRLLEPIFAAPGPGSVWGRASLIGVGCAIVGLGPYHFAQRELPSGIATTLFASTPLFTLPLAWVLGSRVGWKALVGTVVGFLGVAGILRVGQAEPPLSLGPGPEVVLTSQDAIPERQGARKPSFLRTLSPPRVRLGSDAQGGTFPFVAVAAVATGGPAESAEVGGADLRRGPIFFGERGTALPSPRRLLQSAEATDHARAHWADTPMVARLASGGLLIATQQSIGDEGFGYGVRLGFEPDGPPALDLGWLHSDTGEVLHGFADAAPLGSGGAELIWVDDRGGDGVPGMALYRRELLADGSLDGEALIDPSMCDCCPPDILELDDGTLLVAYRDRSPENIRDVFLTRRDPVTGKWSPSRAVHDDGWELDGCPVNGPALAAVGSTVAASWFTQAGPGAIRQLKVAFSKDAGRSFGTPLTVVTEETLGRVALVAVKALEGDERFLLVHLAPNPESEVAGADASWRAGLVSPSGAVSDFVRIADVVGSRSSGRLDLVLASPGVAQAVWTGSTGLVSAELRFGPIWFE